MIKYLWFNSIINEYQYGSWMDYLHIVRSNPKESVKVLESICPNDAHGIRSKVSTLNEFVKLERTEHQEKQL